MIRTCVRSEAERTKSAITSRADSLKNRKAYLHQQVISFLEDAARKGWRLVRVEPTEAMRKAGMEEAPLNYYEDKVSSRQRISMDTDEVGPVFRAMCDATPKYGVEE